MKDYNKILLNKIDKEFSIREKIELEGKRNVEPNLLNISNALDDYYFINKLKIYCAYLSYTKFTNPDFISYSKQDLFLIEEILQKREAATNPLTRVYNCIRILYETIDDAQPLTEIEKYVQEIDQALSDILETEHIDIYSYLTNYFTYKFNTNQIPSLQQYLIYSVKMISIQFKLAKKKERFLIPTTFRNLVTAALHLKEQRLFNSDFMKSVLTDRNYSNNKLSKFQWVEAFINSLKSRLSSSDAEYYYNYCIALLHVQKKEFGKAYRLLGNPKRQQGMFINMNTRVLHLVILFEVFNTKPKLLEYDDIDIPKVMESFRGLIRDEEKRKKQISAQYLAIYKRFAQCYKKLYALNLKLRGITQLSDKELVAIEELIGLVEKEAVPFKGWILEKIKEIAPNK